MSDASAERQPADAGDSEGSTWRGESMAQARGIEILPERAAPARRLLCIRVHDDAAHQPQVDDEAAVADAMPRDAVTAAADGDREIQLAGEPDGGDRVYDVERTDDHL